MVNRSNLVRISLNLLHLYKLKYSKSKSKTSLGRARALAVGEASGEYLAFLDCDDLWHEKKLEKQIDVISAEDIKKINIYFII